MQRATYVGCDWRLARTVVAAALCVSILGCDDKPSGQSAEDHVRSVIDEGSDSRLVLKNFSRTDGREGEESGVKVYTVMFTADAEFVQDAMYQRGDLVKNAASEIKTREYADLSGEFSWGTFMAGASGFRSARKGDVLHLNGEVAFEKRESGWVATRSSFVMDHDSTTRRSSASPGALERAEEQTITAIADTHTQAMRDELAKLHLLQEAFYERNNFFASVLEEFPGTKWSRDVKIIIKEAGENGFYAIATHSLLGDTQQCGIALGTPEGLPAFITSLAEVHCVTISRSAIDNKAYFKAMMDNLRDLRVQQELHFSKYGSYASQLSDLSGMKQLEPGVSITILGGDKQFWSALASHARLGKHQKCGIASGFEYRSEPALSFLEKEYSGIPQCTGE